MMTMARKNMDILVGNILGDVCLKTDILSRRM